MAEDRQELGSMQYTLRMRPLLKKKALFSDETEMFRSPMEAWPGDLVTIRFRTARNNADAVYLHHGGTRMELQWQETQGDFDYYAAQILLGKEPYAYIFEVVLGGMNCFYDRYGVTPTRYREAYLTSLDE